MMLFLRDMAGKVPPPVGKALAWVPPSWRLGAAYTRAKRDLEGFRQLSVVEQKEEATRRVRAILERVARGNAFYRKYYEAKGFDAASVQRFEDLERIPVVTKADLNAVPLRERSMPQRGCIKTNTGGSSGSPLEFYLDRYAFAREWAHMHDIWSRVGYTMRDLKLTFRGKNLGDEPLRYNAVYNEYYVNAYCPPDRQAAAVKAIARPLRIVHGYPSSIYAFVRYCAEHNRGVLDLLRKELKGVLLASEYPAPVYRDLIEGELDTPSVSWYGHSEMAVLAYEVERFVYAPFQSYGFTEAVADDEGRHHLVGTGYYNHVSPFIRYDTEDAITPEFEDGLLARFTIETGRLGEFVEDANGARISLTALIFGRHHKVFGLARFIQVRQTQPGRATLIVTAPQGVEISEEDVRAGFDDTNVAIAFDIEVRREPVRAPSGKVPVLIR
ncbi:MAG TPA: hypothetical protein ENN80_10155 [Candidatus Hydrogenedentes bacterium]|nr:hypothetical protein [Candidatus Hydrogenedentota bacterium]